MTGNGQKMWNLCFFVNFAFFWNFWHFRLIWYILMNNDIKSLLKTFTYVIGTVLVYFFLNYIIFSFQGQTKTFFAEFSIIYCNVGVWDCLFFVILRDSHIWKRYINQSDLWFSSKKRNAQSWCPSKGKSGPWKFTKTRFTTAAHQSWNPRWNFTHRSKIWEHESLAAKTFEWRLLFENRYDPVAG